MWAPASQSPWYLGRGRRIRSSGSDGRDGSVVKSSGKLRMCCMAQWAESEAAGGCPVCWQLRAYFLKTRLHLSQPGRLEQSCVLVSKAWTALPFQTPLGMPRCSFGSDPFVLQACDITGGLYLKVPQMPSLLQYLLVSQ